MGGWETMEAILIPEPSDSEDFEVVATSQNSPVCTPDVLPSPFTQSDYTVW